MNPYNAIHRASWNALNNATFHSEKQRNGFASLQETAQKAEFMLYMLNAKRQIIGCDPLFDIKAFEKYKNVMIACRFLYKSLNPVNADLLRPEIDRLVRSAYTLSKDFPFALTMQQKTLDPGNSKQGWEYYAKKVEEGNARALDSTKKTAELSALAFLRVSTSLDIATAPGSETRGQKRSQEMMSGSLNNTFNKKRGI